jgi:DNA-binding CsgD family transcriptional regulator/tetratricopeptide (TPR) repeat protein
MQPKPFLHSPSPVGAARQAYLNDDLAACLAALDAATSLSESQQREALLLRARVLLRLYRPAEVLELLGPVLGTFVGADEMCTARMLHSLAVTRCASVDRGLALLEDLNSAATGMNTHRAIRAEIAYWTAFAHWLKRDYRAALELALVAEAAGVGVISVRAAALRGYVAAAREYFGEALLLFRSALENYHHCRERDTDLLYRIVVQIASLEVALRSAKVAGSQAESSRTDLATRASIRPSPTLNEFRMVTQAMDAWLFAFDGDFKSAYRRARVAQNLAPSPAWRVWSLANRAQITSAFGELAVAAEFAAEAVEIADTVDWNVTSDEARVGLLLLAESLALTDPLAAVRILHRYEELTSEIDRALLFHDDVRLWILETFVGALVHRIRGEYAQAREAFEAVHATAQRVGIVWRAALALIELDATPVADGRCAQPGLAEATRLVGANFPHSFLARRLYRWPKACRDGVIAKLSPAQRKVLRHILAAKSQKEIATAMGLSTGTAHNYVTKLLKVFGVHSTAELIVGCYDRGIGSPAWWDDLEARM